jgi:fatty-acyl-CoA synthase
VSSLQLEDLIGQHPGVAEVAVIGVPDAKWGERPRAVVVPRKGTAIEAAALRAHLAAFVDRGEISKYAVPEEFVFADGLDKTSVGKLDKKALRQKHGGAR